MDDYLRYALYLVPEGALGFFGEIWLGWDMTRGMALPQPGGAPESWAAITAEPRRYGFHATVKPPFRLADGQDFTGLEAAVCDLCARTAAVDCVGLRLTTLDGFLALVPEGETGALDALAAQVVTDLDVFRRPAGADEIARRRASGLSKRQDDNLLRWGYPYVLADFRAHFTLSGRLGADRDAVAAHLAARLADVPLRPFRVESLCLVGELPRGGFRLIHRYKLSG